MATAFFQPDFFANNRRALGTELSGGLFVLTAYAKMQRSADMAQPFTQEASMWYLTGIDAHDWKVIYDGTRGHTWLIEPDMSQVERIFDGAISSAEIRKISGADEIIPHKEFEPLLRQLARKHSAVHTVFPEDYGNFVHNPAPAKLVKLLERTFSSVLDCRQNLIKLRAIKQPREISAITKAVAITAKGFEALKKTQLRHEYDIESAFTTVFRAHKEQHAYDPIVASGYNACTLHYAVNNDQLQKNKPVLLDIGASFCHYAADISRTFTITPPTERQRRLHASLLKAQQQIIQLLKPGLSFRDYMTRSDEILIDAFLQANLIKSPDDTAGFRAIMPHAVSHGLGVDVHDRLGGGPVLKPGMVLTVEPGLYLPKEHCGMRIEDDILITETGHRNLSKAIPYDLDYLV